MLSQLAFAVWALRTCVSLNRGDGYLAKTGWLRSRVLKTPVNADGEAIPWITYSSLTFLESHVRSDMRVFEFGSGSSTLWWARRVRRVVSCEHDAEWYSRTRALVPENVELYYMPREADRYSRKILEYDNEFDIVVIDGRDRVKCVRNSLAALRPDGIVLWDNSDREYYRPGFSYLEAHGFRRLDFFGFGPINTNGWCTTIFYRDANCLAI